MSAPIRFKSSDELFLIKGGDTVHICTGTDVDDQIVVFHDEIPELIEALSKIIKEKK